MTVEQLISEVLNNIQNHFYGDRVREFKRDERALMKAVLTYGKECESRGWDFDATFIFRDIIDLLKTIRTSGADIQYLPIYLEGAIKRHIGGRAEELSAEAKKLPPKVANVVAGIRQVEAVREPSTVEVMTKVLSGLNKINRARRRRQPGTKEKQQVML